MEEWSRVLKFSSIMTFCITKAEKHLKQVPHYCFEKKYYFAQKC